MTTLTPTETTTQTPAEPGRHRDRFAPLFAQIEAEQAEREAAAKRVEDAAERGAARQIEVASGGALLDSKQVAALLSVPVSTVQALSRDGKLPTVRVGRTHRYRRAAVEAWIEAQES